MSMAASPSLRVCRQRYGSPIARPNLNATFARPQHARKRALEPVRAADTEIENKEPEQQQKEKLLADMKKVRNALNANNSSSALHF